MSLATLQRSFSAGIRQQWANPAAYCAEPGLEIYRNNYRAQLVACLKDTFGRAYLWLGETEFTLAAEAHIKRTPPSSWTLDAYGRDFPVMLRACYPNDPEIHELAWIDLAMSEAFVTPDCTPISIEQLQDVDWDAVALCFVPSVNFTVAMTNAAEIWSELFAGREPPAAQPLADAGGHLVWRMGFAPKFRALSRQEMAAITLARAGMPFRDLCATMTATLTEGDAAQQVGEFLGRWLADGLLTGVREA